MTSKTNIQTEKSTVAQLREIREKVNLEIKDLSAQQLKDYLNKKETLHPAKFWKKLS